MGIRRKERYLQVRTKEKDLKGGERPSNTTNERRKKIQSKAEWGMGVRIKRDQR